MAQPTVQAERPSSEIDYQPLSGVAVAAVAVSGIYILVVAMVAIIALYTRRPLLNILLIVPAALGLGLAIAARAHIKRSEGTRTGLHLANAAWWMSVIGGAAFGSYFFATYETLKKDSKATGLHWFELLKDGKYYAAYLMAVDPSRRNNVNPDNKAEMEANFPALVGYMNSEIVYFFERNGKDVVVESQGMGSFDQTPLGFKVDGKFTLKCAEGIFEINLGLVGKVDEESDRGREWFIATMDFSTFKNLTTYGKLIRELQPSGLAFSQDWIDKVIANRSMEVYLDTLPQSERDAAISGLESSNLDATLFVTGATAIVPIQHAIERKLKVNLSDKNAILDDLLRRKVLQLNGPDTKERLDQLIDIWKLAVILRKGTNRQVLNPDPPERMTITPQAISVSLPIELQAPGLPISFVRGRLFVESRTPELISELMELKNKGPANADNTDGTTGPVLKSRPPLHWRVVRLETDLEKLAENAKAAARRTGLGGR